MNFTQDNLPAKEDLYQNQAVKKLVTNWINNWISYFKIKEITKESNFNTALQKIETIKNQEHKLLIITIIIDK